MNPIFLLKPAAVQMKSSPDPVFIKDPNQPAVLNPAVVITHRQCLVLPARIAAIDFVHFFFLFILLMRDLLSDPIVSRSP